MPKIKRRYYRRAKEMTESTISITQNIICNSVLFGSASSTSSNNISLSNSTNYISNNFLLKQNIYSNNYQLNDDLDNLEQINSINNSINFINSNNSIKSINSINNSNYSEESNDVLENENINDSNFDINEIINIVNSPRSDNLIDDSSSFISWLQEWVLRNRISHVALNELLTRIKPKYPALPLDACSLLKTPRKVNVQNVRSGQYYHFGLSNCIKQLLLRYSVKHLQCVKVNIDGLPLFKSSSSQVYPIL